MNLYCVVYDIQFPGFTPPPNLSIYRLRWLETFVFRISGWLKNKTHKLLWSNTFRILRLCYLSAHSSRIYKHNRRVLYRRKSCKLFLYIHPCCMLYFLPSSCSIKVWKCNKNRICANYCITGRQQQKKIVFRLGKAHSGFGWKIAYFWILPTQTHFFLSPIIGFLLSIMCAGDAWKIWFRYGKWKQKKYVTRTSICTDWFLLIAKKKKQIHKVSFESILRTL